MTVISHEFAWPRRDEVLSAVTRLQKRAAKLGVPFFATVSVLPTREVEETAPDPLTFAIDGQVRPTGRMLQWGTVGFDVAQIRFPGWKLVGVLTPMPVSETGNETVLFPTAVPGEEMPSDVRTWSSRCDHCQASRDRKETFVLRHDDGSVKQVGRQCIRDFLGHDANTLLAQYNFLQSIARFGDEDSFGFGGGYRSEGPYKLDVILAATSAVIRAKGWMSRKRSNEIGGGYGGPTPTSALVREYLYDDTKDARELRTEVGKILDEDRAAAEVARAFWLADKGSSDYSQNAQLLASAGLVIDKAWGLAVSLLPVSQSIGQKQAAAAAANAGVVSAHVGTIGKREIFEVEVIGEREFTSDYGTKTLLTMRTAEGNLIKWWASGDYSFMPKANDGTFKKIKATVKQHGQYDGKLETTINRAVEA